MLVDQLMRCFIHCQVCYTFIGLIFELIALSSHKHNLQRDVLLYKTLALSNLAYIYVKVNLPVEVSFSLFSPSFCKYCLHFPSRRHARSLTLALHVCVVLFGCSFTPFSAAVLPSLCLGSSGWVRLRVYRHDCCGILYWDHGRESPRRGRHM